MKVQSAISLVLEKAAEPLPTSEIAKRIFDANLWQNKGNTPEKTISARISSDIRNNADKSSFVRTERGVYTVRDRINEMSDMDSSNQSSHKPFGTGVKGTQLTFTDSAQRILERSVTREPMHYREITKKALAENLLASKGKTPEATMLARIGDEVKKQKKRGDRPRFILYGEGYVGLSEWPKSGLPDDQVNLELDFSWISFYEAIANNILKYQNRRTELINGILEISLRVNGMGNLRTDQFADGSSGPLRDICPFTTIGTFNRSITLTNRQTIANEIAQFIGVSGIAPHAFPGIPTLSNMKSWFFRYDKDRGEEDIDLLWEVFAQAIAFADTRGADSRAAFISSYEEAIKLPGVKWNLTMGLYWIRPLAFPTLDSVARNYIRDELNIHIDERGISGSEYLEIADSLIARFKEAGSPVQSFPELSLMAWDPDEFKIEGERGSQVGRDGQEELPSNPATSPPSVRYTIDNVCRGRVF